MRFSGFESHNKDFNILRSRLGLLIYGNPYLDNTNCSAGCGGVDDGEVLRPLQ